MQEATGQASLMNIMLVIIGIIIILLAGSIAYSKAFRVKNKIVDIVEKYYGYPGKSSVAKNEIDDTLREIGYKTITPSKYLEYCPKDKYKDSNYELVTQKYPGYLYCVYKKDQGSGSYSYKAVAYMYFDLPVISKLILIPVTGETKVIYPKNDWKTVE